MKMKGLLAIMLVVLLAGCSGENNPLEGQQLVGRDNQMNVMTFDGNTLEIQKGTTNVKPYMDTQKSTTVEKKTYKNVHVKVKGDTYMITGENVSMKLKKTGKRIVEDENGEEYVTSAPL